MKEYFWHRLLKRPFKLAKIIDQGSGKDVVVLIHGLASKSQIWLPLAGTLDKKKYRVISYDLLGFGSSPKPAMSKYSTREHARSIIHALKKDLPKGRQIVLLGHSMGCIIAAYIAFTSPDLAKHLILYQPPILLDSTRKTSLHRKLYAYAAKKPPLFLNYVRFVNRFFANRLESFEQAFNSWSSIEKSIQNTILAQATIFELENLLIRTDIVYGRFDFVVSKLDAKKLARINKNIRLHYVTGLHDITLRSAKYLKKLIEGPH